MINSIHMKSCATYSDDGAEILDCKKINFIYGTNGSGKSTISDYLGGKHPNRYEMCSIDSTLDATVMVYNRDFRESNFHSDDLSGIFTLGESTIEEIKELDTLKEQRERIVLDKNKTIESIRKEEVKKEQVENHFKENVWTSVLKANEQQFGAAFSGFRSNKDKFFREVLVRYKSISDADISYDSLVKRAERLFNNELASCEEIEINTDTLFNGLKEVINDEIWSTVIVGNQDVPIAQIMNELSNHDWVNTGRQFLTKKGVCPFCQKNTIDNDFIKQIELYFDDEYQSRINRLHELQSAFVRMEEYVIEVFKKAFIDERILSISKITPDKLLGVESNIKKYFSDNLEIIKQKIIEPTRKVYLLSVLEVSRLIDELVEEGNDNIGEYNCIVENFKTEKEKLSDDIWIYCIRNQKELIANYLRDREKFSKAIDGMSRKVTSLCARIEELDCEIAEKGRNITSVEPTVNEINRLLKAYGFTGFSIAKSNKRENAYQIQRPDGSLAENTLSEGEETFISFLYFLQLTKGALDVDHVSDNKIIVLDDPICSLDSTILYIVSTMVKQLIQDIRDNKSDVKQIFILTHNVFFHKEASFVNGRIQRENDVNFWIIKKENNISNIISYGMDNPISTSYELLWKEIRDDKGLSLITIQNTMRRIIENYFGMLGSRKDDFIKNSFDTIEEKTICESLLSWINDGSHTIPDDLYIDSYSESVEKYKDVFERIFICTGNEAHYNMMMGL